MKSFNALLFAGCFAIAAIIIGASGIVPINSQMILVGIGIFVAIIVYAFILKGIENARDKWEEKR